MDDKTHTRIELILKISGTLLIPVALALMGYFANRYLQSRQELETRARLYSELMSKREEAESALRKDMLKTIVDSFLQSKAASLDAKVLNLELLTYNFHESLYLAPLFYHLEREIDAPSMTYPDSANGKAFKARLKRVAREVIRKQMLILEGYGAKLDGSIGIGEIVEALSALPAEVAFPQSLREKIHFKVDQNAAHRNRLIFQGVMSKEEYTDLLGLSSDKLYQKAIRALYKRSLNLHHIASHLAHWPAEIDIPDALETKVQYDEATQLLIFKGTMASDEKTVLLGLSDDADYQAAVHALFDTSQDLPKRESTRTYQIRVQAEKTLTVDGVDRTFRLTVVEVNLNTEEIKVKLEVKVPQQRTALLTRATAKPRESGDPTTLLAAEFWVGFYDFPMVDNIRLPNDQRCAVVLNKFEEPMTEYTLVCFPGSRASLKEKPYYEEVLRRVLQPRDAMPSSAQ